MKTWPSAGGVRVTGTRILDRMKAAAIVFGVLLALLGAVWIGQGLGFIKGSFMTGQALWAWIGAGCLLAGAGLLAGAALRRPT